MSHKHNSRPPWRIMVKIDFQFSDDVYHVSRFCDNSEVAIEPFGIIRGRRSVLNIASITKMCYLQKLSVLNILGW